VQCDLK